MPGSTVASLRILLGLDAGGVHASAGAVNADLRGVQATATQTNATLGQIGKGLQFGVGLGGGAAAFQLASRAAGEFTGFVTGSIASARDLTETINKSAVVFGPASAQIKAFGETAATSLGLSENSAIAASATFGNLFVSLGLAPEKVAPMSTALVKLAGDLASFNNISTEEALAKLQSGIVGQERPLRELGVAISAAAVDAEAAAEGFSKVNGSFTEGEKVQARYALIFKQTGTAQGDFARTSNALANQQRINQAEFENISSTLGQQLIPLFTAAAHVMSEGVLPAFQAIADNIGLLSPAFAGLGIVLTTKVVTALVQTVAGLVTSATASLGLGAAATTAAAAATTEAAAVGAAATQTELFSAAALAGVPQLELFTAAEIEAAGGAATLAGAQAGTGIAAAGAGAGVSGLTGKLAGLGPWIAAGVAGGLALNEVFKIGTQVSNGLAEAISHRSANQAQAATVEAALVTQHEALNRAEANDRDSAVAVAAIADNVVTPAQLRVAQATLDAATAHAALATAQTDAEDPMTRGTAATLALAEAQVADKAAADELKAAQDDLNASLGTGVEAVGDFGAALDRQVASVLDTSNAWQAYTGSLTGVEQTAQQVITDLVALDGMHVEATVSLVLNAAAVQVNNLADLVAKHVEGTADLTPWITRQQNNADQLARDALAKAKQAAAEFAREMHDKLNKSFDDMATAAKDAYSKLHQHNLDAIKDIHDVANAALDEQERAIRGPVDAEKARVDAIRTHRQELNLTANVQQAQAQVALDTPGTDKFVTDAAALQQAQQALNDFQDDQRLAFLSSQADTQVAALEAEKKANDAKAAVATAAENERNKAQVAALDRDLKNLKDHLSKYTKEWDKAFAEIAAAAKRHNVADLVGVFPVSVATGSKATSALGAPAVSPSATVASGLAPTTIQINNTFQVDGTTLLDIVERHQFNLGGIYNPTPVSTGSQR